MIKSFKAIAVAMVVMSILCGIGGIGLSKLAEANRGMAVSSGYMKNGELVITAEEGRIGANKKGEETAEAMSVMCYVLGVLFFISGIGFAVAVKKMNHAETIRQKGTILEKENGPHVSVIVEFDDNSRKKLFVEPPLIVAQGDKGMIGYKGKALVEFSKEL